MLKEELVALTGHHVAALLLNQLLYWTERMDDVDRYLQEEQTRQHDATLAPTHGWIYKSAGDLVDELMLDVSEVTVRRHLAALLARGFVAERRNPEYRWDRTLQYRVNVVAVQHGLAALGYALDDYPLVHLVPHAAVPATSLSAGSGDRPQDVEPEAQLAPRVTMKDRSFNLKDRSFNLKDRSFNLKDRSFTMKDRSYNVKDRSVVSEGAIPETTAETTSEITAETTAARATASGHAPIPAHHDRRVVVALEALGLSHRQATRAAQRHQLTLPEVARWACWRDRLMHVKNPVALLAATIARQRLPPGDVAPISGALVPASSPSPPASNSDTPGPYVALWEAVCATLQQRLDDGAYATWIADTHLLDVDDDRAVIGTPNVFARDQLATAYLASLSDALREHLGHSVTVEVVIDGGAV